MGIGGNWNNCLKIASGKYIKFLFQDDILKKNCIKKMVNFLEENDTIPLVSCLRDFIIEGEKSDLITKWLKKYNNLQEGLALKIFDNWSLLDESLFQSDNLLISPFNKIGEPSAVMFERKILEEVGYFNEDLSQILDYEFFYRILKIKQIAVLNEKLIVFRLHARQATRKNIEKGTSEEEVFYNILATDFYSKLSSKNKKRLIRYKYPLIFSLNHRLKRSFNFFR